MVLVETDFGLIGVGEGGASDTMEQCAGLLIGEDPFRTDRLWQAMFRAYFYPGNGSVENRRVILKKGIRTCSTRRFSGIVRLGNCS